jgi:hypothetical protein
LWVHGAPGGVHWLWPVIQYINGVLSGERSPAKQQYAAPEEQHQQLLHRFSSWPRRGLSLDGEVQL